MLTLLTDKVDAELMDAAPKLKVVANFAVGFDNIDVPAATQRRILATNTPGVLTDTTADLAFTLLMACARRIVEGHDYAKGGHWRTWGPMLLMGQDVHGATLGIAGIGRIGQAMARRARGFGMRIHLPRRHAQRGSGKGAGRHPRHEGGTAGAVRLPVAPRAADAGDPPLHRRGGAEADETQRDPDQHGAWPGGGHHGALRGPEGQPDLRRRAGRHRPRTAARGSPLYTLDNALVVPHIASASFETRNRMAEMAADNLLAGLAGQLPPNCLNPEAFG